MNARVAIHAHVFYADLWPEIATCIDNVVAICGAGNVALVVTYPEANADIRAEIENRKFGCPVQLAGVPNRGYDVGPFVCEFLNGVDLDSVDYIVKIHTKRDVDTWMNFRPLKGAAWRRELLKFCSTEKAFRNTIDAFSRYPKLGMVTSHRVINYCGSDWGEDARAVKQMLRDEFGLAPRHLVTASGTMFCARAEIFKRFKGRYSFDDFPVVCAKTAHSDYGLAAQLEYAFTMSADAEGYVVSEGTWSPWVARIGYAFQSVVFCVLRRASNAVRSIATLRIFESK